MPVDQLVEERRRAQRRLAVRLLAAALLGAVSAAGVLPLEAVAALQAAVGAL